MHDPSSSARRRSDPPTILLADDDALARKGLRLALRSAGYLDVYEAANQAEVLIRLRSSSVSLMIVDVQMPGDNGIEILRQLRSGLTAARRHLPVIIHTSFAQREVLGAAMALDANGFLVKPVKASQIPEKIERALAEQFDLRSSLAYAAVSTNLIGIPALAPSSDAGLNDETPSGVMRPHRHARISIEEVTCGMRLAENVCTDAGTLLLRRGSILTQLQVNRLADLRGVLAVGYITVT